jgi:hypothetical protein
VLAGREDRSMAAVPAADTCAALLIDAGASPLRLQRRMGHHSAAFTPCPARK